MAAQPAATCLRFLQVIDPFAELANGDDEAIVGVVIVIGQDRVGRMHAAARPSAMGPL